MQSENIIIYKWEHGVYSLEDLIILVKYGNITENQFHDITGFNYAAVTLKTQNPDQKIQRPV